MAGSNVQQLAHQQQMIHLAQAHSQALRLLIEGQQKFKLSVDGALSYLETVKMKLNPLQYKEFQQAMNESKNQNWNMGDTLSKICQLFECHPELIQGFGMFLPPRINLYLQTSSKVFLETLQEQNLSLSGAIPQKDVAEIIDQQGELKDVSMEIATDKVIENENTDVLNVLTGKECDDGNENVKKVVDSNYANAFLKKIKDTFEHQPHIIERFLQLLHSIKKENSGSKASIENKVFMHISELFKDHEDLIEEFKIFVPNAEYTYNRESINDIIGETSNDSSKSSTGVIVCEPANNPLVSSYTSDPSIASVYKYGSYEEHMFFDKVRSALDHTEVYDNFLHCLSLYNEDIVTRSELLKLAASFIGNFPDLLKEFKDILGFRESGDNIEHIPMKIVSFEKQLDSETSSDIDYSTGGRNGASYRALPKDIEQPKCSGRTPLCKEVLNDIWVSFPSWSEDSTFVTSCKTQYEETIYRCEDERFELDMAIESNAYTIQVLENVQKRINKMTAEEKNVFALDDSLGGTSTVLHQRALHRIYGDKTDELVEGLKRNPIIAVPIILKRLKAKEEEWKEKQNQFNIAWREQIDSYYLKSLDHKGINFKQNDSKCFRSKTLLNEMEVVYMERKEGCGLNSYGPHFLQEYKEMHVFEDAIGLISLYLKKLPGIYREDRRRIERMVRGFIPDFYNVPHDPLSDEEIDVDEEDEEDVEMEEPLEMEAENDEQSGHTSPSGSGVFSRDDGDSDQDELNSIEDNDLSDEMDKSSFVEENVNLFDKIDSLHQTDLPYNMFYVNKNWYIFFRQMFILCERLLKLLHESGKLAPVSCKTENNETCDSKDTSNLKSVYVKLIDKLNQLLTGGLDNNQFEEEARGLYGIHAYVCFTMDKLILNIVRQLQQIVSDDICKQCMSHFAQYMTTVALGEFTSQLEVSDIEIEYLKKVQKMMKEENCFKVMWHKKELVLTIELLEPDFEMTEDPCEVERLSSYLEQYITEDSLVEDVIPCKKGLPVFLTRNLRRQIKYWEKRVTITDNLWKQRYSESFLNSNPPMFAFRKRKLHSSSESESKGTESESKGAESEGKGTESEGKGTESEGKSTESEGKGTGSEGKGTESESKGTESEEKITECEGTELEFKGTESVGKGTDFESDGADFKIKRIESENKSDEPECKIARISPEMKDCKDIKEQDSVSDLEAIVHSSEEIQECKEDNLEVKTVPVSASNCVISSIDDAICEKTGDSTTIRDNDKDSKSESLDKVIAQPDCLIELKSGEVNIKLNIFEAKKQDTATSDVPEVEYNEEAEHVLTPSDIDVEVQEIEPDTDCLESNIVIKSKSSNDSGSDADESEHVQQDDSDDDDNKSNIEGHVEEIEFSISSGSSDGSQKENDDESSEINFDIDSSSDESQIDQSPLINIESDFDGQQNQDYDSDSSYKSHDDSSSTKEQICKEVYDFSKKKCVTKYGLKNRFHRKKDKQISLSEECDVNIDYAYFSQLSLEDKCHFLAMESLIIQDNTECSFQRNSYKMDYVCNSGMVLYRRNSISKAQEIHYQASEVKTSKFNFWHRIWLERYVTPTMLKTCISWLRRSDPDIYKVCCNRISNTTRPPYFSYNKYKIRYYKIAQA